MNLASEIIGLNGSTKIRKWIYVKSNNNKKKQENAVEQMSLGSIESKMMKSRNFFKREHLFSISKPLLSLSDFQGQYCPPHMGTP